jgi:hypothetical protein
MTTTTQVNCTCVQPSKSKLYPRSVYRCDDCGTVHGTRAYNGAVNWQCPRELVLGQDYHEPANQTFIGNTCGVCNLFIPKGN